jgi:hypothetical protein
MDSKYNKPTEMTSVLYGAGLNYQLGNPVRQEIVAVRRDLDNLRKQVELLTEENLVYRKHLMILLQKEENTTGEFTKDLMELSSSNGFSFNGSQRQPGGATVQGAGFRR